jgi:hypothetical protein
MADRHGMEARRLTWNANHKGIDDWQLALKNKRESERTVRILNFKERFIMGLCAFSLIHDLTADWDSAPEDGMGLAEYLGLTEEETEIYLQGGGDLERRLLAQRKTWNFRIYQLELNHDVLVRPWAFSGIAALRAAGYEQPPAGGYRLMHDADLLCHKDLTNDGVLKLIFARYNDSLPDDYHGRSVSPSDVIELYDDEGRRYYSCDTAGFVPVKFSPMLALSMKAAE